ncbi:MAG: Piwi domain-containing protein [Cyanobacteria bacterium P01_G01_bin.38]
MTSAYVPESYSVSLNFFSIAEDRFEFRVYRKITGDSQETRKFDGIKKHSLPLSLDALEERRNYWISLIPHNGFDIFQCASYFNNYITIDYLYYLLVKKCRLCLDAEEYIEKDSFFSKKVIFILRKHSQGNEAITFKPYYLKSARKFGFLADFKFLKNSKADFSKEVQKLSLSLDRFGRENKNFYFDKYSKIDEFKEIFLSKIFPLASGDDTINIVNSLLKLPAKTLKRKTYVFGRGNTSNSQYAGIRRFGPFEKLVQNPKVFFVFRQQDRLISLDLYEALKGAKYSTLFPGTEKMFGFPLTKRTVTGIPVENFSDQEMERVRDEILSSGESLVAALIIAPWDSEDNEKRKEYYHSKHIFATARIPSQVVRVFTLEKDSRLKWSTSNIALQCFSKLGGKPWKVKPQNKKCLIIGVGQSHYRKYVKGKTIITKYYAYSVLSDSSGLFKELRVLGESADNSDYLTQLKANVRAIIEDHSDEFDHYVIHAPYKLRRDELDSLSEVFKTSNQDNNFVVLKINPDNHFFGYCFANNSLVPFESSYLCISNTEYIVWFEGLDPENTKVSRRYAAPVHIEFSYWNRELSYQDKVSYLQDAVNLSGANWRGFNAKNSPVSMYYAQLIARFTNKFNEFDLPQVDLETIKPWFL